ITAVVAPEKPVSAKTCSAAVRMRASLSWRRRSRRPASGRGVGLEPPAFVFCRFIVSPVPLDRRRRSAPRRVQSEIDRLVRLGLGFASVQRLSNARAASKEWLDERGFRRYRGRQAAPGRLRSQFRRHRAAVGPQARARRFQPLLFLLRSEEHTSELQSQFHLVCRLLLEKKKK